MIMQKEVKMAYISNKAVLGNNVTIGKNVIIEDYAIVGDNTTIACGAIIKKGSKIGENVRIDENAIIGKLPLKAKRSVTTKEKSYLPAQIGDNTLIGAGAIIYIGATIGKNILIADYATIREESKIGDYTIVGRGVAIENGTKIGKYCKIETNAYITAYSNVEDYVFIAPSVSTSNDNFLGRTEERFKHFKGVTIKKGGRIGVGATILPGITIFEDAVVAAGSVVTKDVPEKVIFAGVPAKYFRDVPKEQLLENQGWEEKK